MNKITRGGYCQGHGPMRKLGLSAFDVHPNPKSEETHTYLINVWMCSSCGETTLIADSTTLPSDAPHPPRVMFSPMKTPDKPAREPDVSTPAPPTLPLVRIAELISTASGVAWHRDSLTDADANVLEVFAEKLKSYAAPEKDRPMRFRFARPVGQHETEGSAHPADAPMQYGTYFPRTDLCITDMGQRGTGRPHWPGIKWIDEEGMHVPSSYSFDVAFIVQEMHFLKSDITPAHLALMIDKAAEHADGCPHSAGRPDCAALKAFAERLRKATIRTPSV